MSVREQLKALVSLAEIDAKARGIADQLKGLPGELDERRAAVRHLEALVSGQRTALAEAERLLAAEDLDLGARNEALSKAKGKSAKARNGREAELAEREVEAVRRSIKDGETQRDALKERIEKIRTGLEEPSAALTEAQGELQASEAALEPTLATLRAEHARIVEGREAYVKQLPKETLRLYQRVVKGRPPAVCEVTEGWCSGCRMAVAPQRLIEIQRGNVLNCQSCQRFLYVKSSLEG